MPKPRTVMNDLYVCIKVDREERPDIDAWLQKTLAVLGRPGGWPLTAFLNSKGEPFWGGTYFPKEESFGRVSFKTVLRQLAQAYQENPDQMEPNVRQIAQRLDEAWYQNRAGTFDMLKLERIAGCDRAELRHLLRRRHGRAEISQRADHRADVARVSAHRHAAIPLARAVHARLYGPRRHLRSDRRRLLALHDRRGMADPAFREDALRQCADARSDDAGVAARPSAGTQAAHRGNDRLGLARDAGRERGASRRASTPTAKAKRASSMSGRKAKSTRARRAPMSIASSRPTASRATAISRTKEN